MMKIYEASNHLLIVAEYDDPLPHILQPHKHWGVEGAAPYIKELPDESIGGGKY